jgi:hypothetical protein
VEGPPGFAGEDREEEAAAPVSEPGSEDALATLTHARLRAAQGDIAGARRLLHILLRRRPDDREARALLERLSGASDRGAAEPPDETLEPPEPAEAASLAASFRTALGIEGRPLSRRKKAERLRVLLERIRARGGTFRAR